MVSVNAIQEQKIHDLSSQEHGKVLKAQREFGSFNDLCITAIALLESAFVSTKSDRFLAGGLYLTIIRNTTLAYFSYVRGHVGQGDLNSRQMIELCALTAYLLNDPNGALTNDILKSEKTLKQDSYKFLEGEYRDLSNRLKEAKDDINKYTAHGSITSLVRNTQVSSTNQTLGTFFDRHDNDYYRANLVRLARLVLVIIQLLRSIAEKHGGFIIRDDLASNLLELKGMIDGHIECLKSSNTLNNFKTIEIQDRSMTCT